MGETNEKCTVTQTSAFPRCKRIITGLYSILAGESSECTESVLPRDRYEREHTNFVARQPGIYDVIRVTDTTGDLSVVGARKAKWQKRQRRCARCRK